MDELESILGRDGLSRDAAGVLVLAPGSSDALENLARLVTEGRLRLSFDDAPPTSAARLTLGRLDHVFEIDADNLTALIEPGVMHAALGDALALLDLYWPVAPLPGHATVADSFLSGLALGRSGRFPDLRHWVLGAGLIAGGGLRIPAGGGTIKNSAGYDLTRAAAGAGGETGIPATLRLRLERRPAARRAVTIALPDAGDAAAVLALAQEELEIVERLSFAGAATIPAAARLRFAGPVAGVDRLASAVQARFRIDESNPEPAALQACAAAASVVVWNCGPETGRRIAAELARRSSPDDISFVWLPQQRRGFATGADPASLAALISSAGAAPIIAGPGFRGPPLTDRLAPAIRTLDPTRPTP
jgi:FAD/FMN-containing dehydrogenase